MMPIPMLIAMLVPAVAASAAPATPSLEADAPKRCVRPSTQMATVLRKNVAPRRLDQLPPGRLELTVMREIDNCPIPAVLRDNIGGNRR